MLLQQKMDLVQGFFHIFHIKVTKKKREKKMNDYLYQLITLPCILPTSVLVYWGLVVGQGALSRGPSVSRFLIQLKRMGSGASRLG